MKRRDFIKAMGTGAIGLMLGGCDFKSPIPAANSDNTSSEKQNSPAFTDKIEFVLWHAPAKKSARSVSVQVLCMSHLPLRSKKWLSMQQNKDSTSWIRSCRSSARQKLSVVH
ncbi:hypothetical protein SPACI_021930 [Sporomusa acidovorans DSM 3132]|uniref:Twin-arginine translocation signal domain-containing protein n=1 Tax=Sporomusa acidovorans (strain ATCC 49682 / DSM 3132 / Mol) TaxID=1123286 RepID=A0ABZ3J2H8_SPOA4|nr:hypothetical protein SPACI_02090 [Sporomusa acidovorans DSM 3132]SDF37944.1 hypothetical protein SAMN04488499_104638 [Sporomusa acidovorans]